MSQDHIIRSSEAPAPVGAYPHARRVGDFIFLSGVGPRKPGTNEIPGTRFDEDGNVVEYDIEAQTLSVFANVRSILEAAGAHWENIVDVTVFLTNMRCDFPVFNRLWHEHFGTINACRTTIEVGALPTPIAVELKVIAYVGS
ncbi:MAG: RidA family protein [Chlorobi bacterium]|nr:RidA family protein [Chlorobiota bacterium]